MPTLLKSKDVRIRNKRQCFACLRKFEPGTTMNSWACVDAGRFNAGYTCLTCSEIMQNDKDSEEFPEGYTLEILNVGETPEQALIRLTK